MRWLIVLVVLLIYGVVGAMGCADHDLMAEKKRPSPKYPPPVYTAEAGR